MDRYICIRQLETKTVDGEPVTVLPGSVWLMKPRSYWNSSNIMTNEVKPE